MKLKEMNNLAETVSGRNIVMLERNLPENRELKAIQYVGRSYRQLLVVYKRNVLFFKYLGKLSLAFMHKISNVCNS